MGEITTRYKSGSSRGRAAQSSWASKHQGEGHALRRSERQRSLSINAPTSDSNDTSISEFESPPSGHHHHQQHQQQPIQHHHHHHHQHHHQHHPHQPQQQQQYFYQSQQSPHPQQMMSSPMNPQPGTPATPSTPQHHQGHFYPHHSGGRGGPIMYEQDSSPYIDDAS